MPVANDLWVQLVLSYYRRSKTRESAPDPLTEVPAYGLVNVSLALMPTVNDRWQAGLYVRNLTNQHFASSIGLSTFAPPGTYVNWVNRETLRTVGISFQRQL